MQTERFPDALGAGQAEALLEKLAEGLAVVESGTLRNILRDVGAEALLDTLAEKIAVVEV